MTIIPRGSRFGVKAWDRGTKRYRWLGTFATEAEARAAEADAMLRPGKDSPTVEQWGRVWLSDCARPAPATRMVYRQAVKAITSEIGQLKLGGVDRLKARQLANDWPRNTSAIARTMWNDAIDAGMATENPWANLRLKQSRGRKDISALTESQVLELAETASAVYGDYGTEARAIILTLGFVGVRPGELSALEWDDFDAKNHDLHVRRAVDGAGGVKLPKNGRTRIAPLPRIVVDAILRVPHLLGDERIFHTPRGAALNKSNLGGAWRRIATAWEATGHPHIDLYELRHACATMLRERGVPASDVAVQLGHTDGGVLVAKLYGHPDEALARDRLKLAFGDPVTDQRTQRGAASA